jgi:hypothetical protein
LAARGWAPYESSAADGVVVRTATIADICNEIICGDEAEGKKCKDDIHDLLLWLVWGRPYTVVSRVWI